MVKETERSKKGVLYIVATPIGNLADISSRAVTTLSTVDFILAEDTRHSKRLLDSLNITKQLISLHAHNEERRAIDIIGKLEQGFSCALISDAGTPLISDPGFPLVRLAQQKNIKVTPIPGPTALITALSASGIAADKFIFAGFLPAKGEKRINKLRELLGKENTAKQLSTVILYEAPHRIKKLLEELLSIEDREVTIARELTKKFEQIVTKSTLELLNLVEQGIIPEKGEFVVIISAKAKKVIAEKWQQERQERQEQQEQQRQQKQPTELAKLKSAEQLTRQRALENGMLTNETKLDEPNKNYTINLSQAELLSILLQKLSVSAATDIAVKLTKDKKKDLYMKALQLNSNGDND